MGSSSGSRSTDPDGSELDSRPLHPSPKQDHDEDAADGRPLICIVDDDDSVRKALSRLIRSHGHRVETFADATAFLTSGVGSYAACAILDVRLPELSGLEIQKRLASAGVDIPIVFLTGHGDIPMSVEAMRKGATDFLVKPADESAVLAAIEAAVTRHEATRKSRMTAIELRRRLAKLTLRETEVLRYVISGAMNKQIAAWLDISEKTVKVHRGRVMSKMEALSVIDLAQMSNTIGIEPAKHP